MKVILQYLKTHGERADTEIAEAAVQGEVMSCHSIRYEKGKRIEGIKCRLAGYISPAASGRKPKSQLKLS